MLCSSHSLNYVTKHAQTKEHNIIFLNEYSTFPLKLLIQIVIIIISTANITKLCYTDIVSKFLKLHFIYSIESTVNKTGQGTSSCSRENTTALNVFLI